MRGWYEARGREVVLIHGVNDRRVAAECDRAVLAAQMLNRARELNDKHRRYTASARLIGEVERLPGFNWKTEEGLTP